jgi:cysteine synthase A
MKISAGMIGSIGNTPLIRLERLSAETGCAILGKAEFLNPGGSVKDRAALAIIRDAEARGALKPGGAIVEGTAGNTGIGLTLVGNALGYRTVIVMPDTQSQEKKDALRVAGADLRLVPAKPYSDPGNYVRYSERLAAELAETEPNGAVWANQFDNLANAAGHRATTGAEIWDQTQGRIDAFTCAAGTGGTIAGVGQALKARNAKVQIVLADPMGSALYHLVTDGAQKSEGNSIAEGIGNSRITANLKAAPIDRALQIPDEEALEIVYGLIRDEGLVLGGSSGINVAAAVRLARDLGPGHTIATILCDGGMRYQSKLFNPAFLKERNLPLPTWLAGQVHPDS